MREGRPSKEENFLDIAAMVAERSPCFNRAQWGAIIVVDGVIVSTGYNGSPRGCINCGEKIPCLKNMFNEPRLTSYNYCVAVHAEVNAIINAARKGTSVLGGTLYLSPSYQYTEKGSIPCFECQRLIINAGLSGVYYRNEKGILQYATVDALIHLTDEWVKGKIHEYWEAHPDLKKECIDILTEEGFVKKKDKV